MTRRFSVTLGFCAVLLALLLSGCGEGDKAGTGRTSDGGGPTGTSKFALEEAKWAYREAAALEKEMQHRYAAAKAGAEKFTLWGTWGPEVKGGAEDENVKALTNGMAEYFPDHLAALAEKYNQGEPNGPHAEEFKKWLADPEFPRLREIKAKIEQFRVDQKFMGPGKEHKEARMLYETGMALMLYEVLPAIEDEKGAPNTLTPEQRKATLEVFDRAARLVRSSINEDRLSKIQCTPERFQRAIYQKVLDHVMVVLKPDDRPKENK